MLANYYYTSTASAGRRWLAGRAGRSPLTPRVEYRRTWLQFDSQRQRRSTQTFELELHLGVDGISLALIVLTTLLTVSCVLISWDAIRDREAEFYVALLVAGSGAVRRVLRVRPDPVLRVLRVHAGAAVLPDRHLGRAAAAVGGDQVLSVHACGQPGHAAGRRDAGERRRLGRACDTPTSLPELAEWLQSKSAVAAACRSRCFLMLAAGFMVKVPVFPLHTWLPLAHVEAPTAGSVLLAGVLLKLGTYGFLRLCLPLLPAACTSVGVPLIAILSVVGIVYGSLCALVQRDIKKLVAYSSVAHLGFCMLGLFALNAAGISGGVLQMINHGLSTGGLFLLVGMIYDRYHTRSSTTWAAWPRGCRIWRASWCSSRWPASACRGSTASWAKCCRWPACSRHTRLYAVLGADGRRAGGVVSADDAAAPALRPAQGAAWRPWQPRSRARPRPHLRELLAIAPVAAACLLIGVRPQPLLDSMRPEIERVGSSVRRWGGPASRRVAIASNLTGRNADLSHDCKCAALAQSRTQGFISCLNHFLTPAVRFSRSCPKHCCSRPSA